MGKDSDELLKLIVEQALYLEERFFEPLSKGEIPPKMELHHMLSWERALANKGSIKKRLSLYTSSNYIYPSKSTEWVEVLRSVLIAYEVSNPSDRDRYSGEHDYSILLQPFVQWIKSKIDAEGIFDFPEIQKARKHFLAHIKHTLDRKSVV